MELDGSQSKLGNIVVFLYISSITITDPQGRVVFLVLHKVLVD